MASVLQTSAVQAPVSKRTANVAKVYEQFRKLHTSESDEDDDESGGADKVKPTPIKSKRDKSKPAAAKRFPSVERVTATSVECDNFALYYEIQAAVASSSRTKLNNHVQVNMSRISLLTPEAEFRSARRAIVASNPARSALGSRIKQMLPRRPKTSTDSFTSTSLSSQRNRR